MYRRDEPKKRINVIFDDGGLGDNIARLPVVKFIYDYHKHITVELYVPDYFKDFAVNCTRGMTDRIKIYNFTEAPAIYTMDNPGYSSSKSGHSNMAQHMTHNIFQLVCRTNPDDHTYYNYLRPNLKPTDITKFNLPEKYVVMTTGFTSAVREFLPKHINEITQHIISKGYSVVFLGKKATPTGYEEHVIIGEFKEDIDYSIGLDLIDQTDLFEAAKIMSNAAAVVGLDNGLLHLAATTDVPIVGGFTTVNPNHRLPYRKGIMGLYFYPVVPDESLKCRFCQSNWLFTYDQDFKECRYEDLKCVKTLKSNKYIEQLEIILDKDKKPSVD